MRWTFKASHNKRSECHAPQASLTLEWVSMQALNNKLLQLETIGELSHLTDVLFGGVAGDPNDPTRM